MFRLHEVLGCTSIQTDSEKAMDTPVLLEKLDTTEGVPYLERQH